MSTTVSSGETATFGMDAFASLAVVPSARTNRGTITFTSAAPKSESPSFTAKLQAKTFGPFLAPMSVSIAVEDGSCTYQLSGNTGGFAYDSNNNVAGLVDGAGKNYPVAQLGQAVDLVPTEVLNDCIFGQLPDGRFVGMGDNDASGDSRLWISTAYSGGTITRVNSSPTYVQSGGMQDTAGAEWSGAGSKIVNVWLPSNGDILMLVRASTASTYHLFRLKPTSNALGTANSNGSDASYSNKKAILDLGRITQGSGAISADVRSLTSRSFCEATIAGAKVYLFAEYNVNGSRTPGGTNDQVFVWQSTDAGATWTKLLTFNTDGSTTNLDHFHGVVQDPYTGWVYFLTGDLGTKCRVIAWDGVSAAPAANASIATINATAGWKCIGGNELHRFTDVCFGPMGLYSLPDSDDEATEATTTAYAGMTLPRTLDYVATIAPAVGRLEKVPPLMNIRSAQGWAALVTFRAISAGYNYLQIWMQDDPNGLAPWRLANEIRTYLPNTARAASFFIGTDGYVYLGGKLGDDIQFTSASKLATSVRLEVSKYTGLLNRFDGP